ncbi:hypothetical protein BH11MYX2_BH11MYX2_05900 [soil metagenome]
MTKQFDRTLFVGGLLVWVVGAILVLAAGQPLSHDEAAFAVGAQRILAGAPAVMLHRSVGTELLAVPGVFLGGSEIALRSTFVIVSLTVPLGAWALARAAFPTRNAGGLAIAILGCTHPMLLQAGQVMSDLPATGLLLLGLALVVRELSRDGGPRWSLAAAAPLFATAFYLRYGSIPVIAAIAVAVPIVYARPLLRSPVRAIVLVALVLALMTPHLLYSLQETSSALGVLEASAGSTRYPSLGEGLWPLVASNPFTYYGFGAAPVMLVGVATAWRTREGRCIAIAAIGTLLVLGIRSFPLPRYTFPWVALLVVAGAGWVASAIDDRRRGLVVTVFVAAWVATGTYVMVTALHQHTTRMPPVALAHDVAKDAAGRPCTLTSSRTTVLVYYSGCTSADWPDADPSARNYLVPPTPEDATLAPPDVPDRRVTRMASHPGVFIIE